MPQVIGRSFLVALVLSPFGAPVAHALCAQSPLENEIRDSEVIVEATMIAMEGSFSARFRVLRVYKGQAEREVVLQTARRLFVSDAQRGQRFVLFLHRYPGGLSINRCGSSGSVRVDAILADVRRAGLTPHAPTNAPTNPVP